MLKGYSKRGEVVKGLNYEERWVIQKGERLLKGYSKRGEVADGLYSEERWVLQRRERLLKGYMKKRGEVKKADKRRKSRRTKGKDTERRKQDLLNQRFLPPVEAAGVATAEFSPPGHLW